MSFFHLVPPRAGLQSKTYSPSKEIYLENLVHFVAVGIWSGKQRILNISFSVKLKITFIMFLYHHNVLNIA